jgi:hypothetical protein
LAIIHKRNEPNLATGQMTKWNFLDPACVLARKYNRKNKLKRKYKYIILKKIFYLKKKLVHHTTDLSEDSDTK